MSKLQRTYAFAILDKINKSEYTCSKCGDKIKSNRYYDAIVKYHLCKKCIGTSSK